MKPSRKLVELSLQFRQLEKQKRKLIAGIEFEQHFYSNSLIENNELNDEELQKFNDLRQIIALNLKFITSLQHDTCSELDISIKQNMDPLFFDYEFETKEQWCGEAGRLKTKLKTSDEPDMLIEYSQLVYEKYYKDGDEAYKEHLIWREEEKADELKYYIKLIDSVITSIEIYYQHMISYQEKKWVINPVTPRLTKRILTFEEFNNIPF